MAKELRRERLFTYAPTNGLLDDLNVRILAELQREPRLTMAELGRRVGLSSPAVTERVRRLEEGGVITGYHLGVSPAALGLPLTAYVRVRPAPGQLSRVAKLAQSVPEIVECHRITGDDCFIMRAHVRDVQHLEELIDRFTPFGSTTTSIVHSSPVPGRGVSVA